MAKCFRLTQILQEAWGWGWRAAAPPGETLLRSEDLPSTGQCHQSWEQSSGLKEAYETWAAVRSIARMRSH